MEINIKELKVQPVLFIRTRTSVDKLPQLIGESYMKIYQYMQGLKEQPAGPPYTAYYNLDIQDMDVEMGFPVSKPLPATEDIKAGKIPAGKAVSTIYKGAYAGMEATYKELFQWITENGYQPKGVYYEYYFNSPQGVPESELLTEIVIPIN